MSYLARLKATDIAMSPMATAATSTSDSFGGSQDRCISENERVERDGIRGQPVGTEAVVHPASHEAANSENIATQTTALTAKRPFDSFGSNRRDNFREIGPEQWGWLFIFAGECLVEVLYIPAAEARQAQARYPKAKVAWLTDPDPRCRGSETVRSELEALIGVVMPGNTANQREALTIALANPEAALTSFRALAADLKPHPLPAHDDRRTCLQCANLSSDGRCRAATRGELPFAASRKYSPVPGVPKRCESYLPRPNDADRRPGRERWPALIEPPADAVRRQQ